MTSDIEHWNSVAPEYIALMDDSGSKSHQIKEQVFNPELMKLIGDVSGLSVMDYGCGFGGLCRMLHSFGARTFGCDISEVFIQKAKEKDVHTEYSLISQKSSYDDNYFDLVMNNFVLFVTEHYKDIVKEMYRITARNGRAIVSLLHPEHYREDEIDPQKPIEQLQDKLGAVVPFTYYKRSVKVYNNLFESVGFQIEEMRNCLYSGDNPNFQKYAEKPLFLIYMLRKTE